MSLQDIHLKNENTRLNQQIDHILAEKNQLAHKLTEIEIEKSKALKIAERARELYGAGIKLRSSYEKIQSTYEGIRKQDTKIIASLLLIILLLLLGNSIVLSYFLLP